MRLHLATLLRPALALVAVLLIAPHASAAACSYDVDLFKTGSGNVRAEVTAFECNAGVTPYQTFVDLVGPTWASSSSYGSSAAVEVADSAGNQLYCAHGYSTYYVGYNLYIDEETTTCAFL